MNAMHTPGPWHVDPDASICVSGPDGNIALMNLARPKAVSEANARLIAACPTMYAYIEARATNGDAEAKAIMGNIHASR